MITVDRLRRLTLSELRWRTSTTARTQAQRLIASAAPPRWNRRHLRRLLASEVLDEPLRAAIAAHDWHAVHQALLQRLRARPARFVLDPAWVHTLPRTIEGRWPEARKDAGSDAERLLRGEHDLLGYRGLRFGDHGAIDWHFDPVHRRHAPRVFHACVPYLDPAIGDHKIIWELNRHQHWLRLGRAAWLTGDARYAAAIVRQLEDWLAANPPLMGVNWASMLELGFRSIAWTWSLHALLAIAESQPGSPWLVDMLVALDRHLAHIEQNLSYYFSPNTHLLGEALALYVVGTALPELRASARFAATGRRVLLEEIDRQILRDGGHAERSAHYQRYTLDFYLLALITARCARDDDAEARFGEAAGRLAVFTRAIADDEGRLPLLGDDDGGMLWPLARRGCRDVRDSLAVAAIALGRPDLAPWGLTEEAVWITGPDAARRLAAAADRPPVQGVPSQAFVDTGYLVLRDGAGGHAVFDTGAHGYLNGGHAHADALAVTLSVAGRPLLADPGTSTYTMDPALRDRMRSSMSHNTVTIDGRSQSVPAGPFHWHTRTDARLEAWRRNGAFDWAEASHDGYAPAHHRRMLLRSAAGGWVVADHVQGGGRQAAVARWHFDPAWQVSRDGRRLRAVHPDGAVAWLLHDGADSALHRGDTQSGLGWHAPVYGTLVPAWTAEVALHGSRQCGLLTWIGDGAMWPSPSLERLAVGGDDDALAARVRDGQRTAVFLLRPAAPHPCASRCHVLDVETDARVLHWVADGDRPLSMHIVDARHVTMMGIGGVSIEADAPIPDLHVSIREGAIDLQASVPPSHLRVRGAMPGNGNLLLIHAGDWRVGARSDGTDSAMAHVRCAFC